MNKKEVLELKRRFKKEAATFTRVCGCYVDGNHNKVCKFGNTFLNLEEDEFYKYLEIANKALSGTIGNNLLELKFPIEEEELGNGVYNAEIYKYDSVAVWPLHETLTDTTVVLDKERLVTLDFKKSIYLEGRFFLQTQHVNHQVDQKDIFNLSYNPDQEVEEDSTGQRVYNLYLRVTQEGGTGDSTKWVNTTAFTIDKFLDQAKAIESSEGQNVINFKINYAERYNADTTACVWGATDVFTLRFTN